MTRSQPPTSQRPDRSTALSELEQRNKECRACGLRVGSLQVVVSEGDPNAPLLIVGEGPGAEEDREGRPFVGQAGQLLDRILEAAGISRQEAYLTNIVKCRTPQNRTPDAAETTTCTGLWLDPQLALLRPRVIVTLGNTATQYLLGTDQGITKLRGQWFQYRHPLSPLQSGTPHQSLLMPLLHPAYLLRNPVRTPGGPKSLTWQDIREVAAVLRGEKTPDQIRGLPERLPGGLFDSV